MSLRWDETDDAWYARLEDKPFDQEWLEDWFPSRGDGDADEGSAEPPASPTSLEKP